MLSKLLSLITYKKSRKPKPFYIPEPSELKDDAQSAQQATDSVKTVSDKIQQDIDSNLGFIKTNFNAPTNKDLIIREFTIAGKYKTFLVFMLGMADKKTINDFILRPLLNSPKLDNLHSECPSDTIMQEVIEVNLIKKITDKKEVIYEIVSGNTALYIEGCDYYIVIETKGFEKRGVDRPQIEGVVAGPQEGFNETLKTNISLIRKNIKNSDLTTEYIKVGAQNQVMCAVMYIKGVTNPAIVDEVKRRVEAIETDYMSGDGMLEQYIEDSPYSLFPTILTTERPDKAIAHLIEGKVIIFAEGAPFAKIVPVNLASFIHSPEDYFMRWQYGTFMRLLRFGALFGTVLLPGLYVAITNFHQEMLPTELLIAIAKAKENVPFPVVVEVLLMEMSFELIREAGIRIPGLIGNTLGIIGALILGQAAVEASIVSPILIIVVAVTGLSNFAIPSFSFAFGLRILRFAFIFAGAVLGFYGISIAWMVTLCLMMSTKSFGINYFSPIAPPTKKNKDTFIRNPVWKQEYRPDSVNALNNKRQTGISRHWVEEDPNYSYDRKNEDD